MYINFIKRFSYKKILRNPCYIVLLCILTGCATSTKKVVLPIYFPIPPAPPRLQFLTSISKPEDVEYRSKFMLYLFGHPPPKAPIIKPYGMAFYNNSLFVCDTVASGIHIIDFKNRKWNIFKPKRGGNFRKPINIVIDSDVLYVTDTLRKQVVINSIDGSYIGVIRNMKATDVAVSSNRIYVADFNKHLIHVYNKINRKELFTIPRESENIHAKLSSPINIALDIKENIYVSDAGSFSIKKYTKEGKYLRTFGKQGDSPGTFARNKGIAVDKEGRLYVVDAAAQLVQIFDSKGRLLLYFGDPEANNASLTLPAKVIIDYDSVDLFRKYAAQDFNLEYLVFVSSQYGPRKISIYGFGSTP